MFRRISHSLLAFVLLFGTISISWSQARADIDSCSASVAPHTVVPGATTDFNVVVTNTDTNPINWIRVTRPSTNFTILSNSAPGWQSTTSSRYAIQTNGTLAPSQSLTITITAQVADVEAGAANWTVQTSEEPGVNIFACSGSLDTAISGYTPDTTPPVISNISVSSLGSDSATISWDTDEPATTQVNYGLTAGYGSSSPLDSSLTTNHSVVIAGLSQNTGYHFQVRSSDDSDNVSLSSDNTFLTTSTDTGSSSGGGGSQLDGNVPKTKIPIKTEPTENVPPVVVLTSNLNNTFVQAPMIVGEATDNEIIAGIEYSVDGGKNWLAVDSDSGVGTNKATFSFTPLNLEDGNYKVLARAVDTSGNIGKSDIKTLVIDRLPPLAGGAVLSMGPQVMNPDGEGIAYSVAGIDQKITLSAVGGPTSIKAIAKSIDNNQNLESFNLTQMSDTGLWTGIISFKNPGPYKLVVEAVDGAGNKTSRSINDIYVAPQSRIVSKKNGEPVNAKVEVFYLEPESNRWTLWDGGSYGQPNPQNTDSLGNFKLFLPEGKYYIQASAKGFRRLTTNIFEINQSKPISTELAMSQNLGLDLGKIEIYLPVWTTSVVDTVLSDNAPQGFGDNKLLESQLPTFALKDTNNEEVTQVSLLGKPTVLTVMNTWSPDSSRQAEVLSELQKNKDINVVPIALQEKLGRVSAFNSIVGREDLVWAIDPDSVLGPLLGPNGVPAHYFVDRRGVVKDIKYGFMDLRSIENSLGGL